MNAPPIKAEPPTTSTRYEGARQQLQNTNTGTLCSASMSAPLLLDEIDSIGPRAVQMFLFAVDGTWCEPYVPSRARRRAKAAKYEGRAQ